MCIRKVPTAIAARVIDKSEDFIRWGLQQGRLPFGTAVQTGKDRWSYHISPKLLAEYSGMAQMAIERMCEERLKEKGGNEE